MLSVNFPGYLSLTADITLLADNNKQFVYRPMTGRCMRSPPQPHLPPPQVVVTRAELYARNKPPQYQKGLTYSQKLANITSGKATRKKAGNDKKSSEVPAEEEGEEFSIRSEVCYFLLHFLKIII